MAEILAALFLVAGSAVSLVAAIGVVRLPDAFLRMHAATKGGMVGAGLVLVGAGFGFGSAEAWLRVVLILAFLLVTLPLASHALGRAAYVGGAPMWSGTMTDQLEGVLARGVFDIDPARVPRQPRTPSAEKPAMSVLPFAAAEPRSAQPPALQAAPGARRVLLALAGGPEAAPALRAGLRVAAPGSGEVTLLSLVCRPSVEHTGAVPLGGMHWARRLAEHRMGAARAAAAALAAELEEECRALGLAFRTRHEEGDASALLAAAAARHDIAVLPRRCWFDQGQVLPPEAAARKAAGLACGPMLVVDPGFQAPRRVLVIEDGRPASGAALSRFLALGLAPDAQVTLAALDLPAAASALAEAEAQLLAHGRRANVLPALLHPDHPPELPGGAPELLVAAHSRSPRGAMKALCERARATLLA
jgi:monovalent cation/proton antiporter MnhG/PhaG subunit